MEEGGPVALESCQEGGRLELGQRHQLAAPEQDVGHGQVHGEDVEERQHTDGRLLRAHELHGGVVQLGHVGHQVPGTKGGFKRRIWPTVFLDVWDSNFGIQITYLSLRYELSH